MKLTAIDRIIIPSQPLMNPQWIRFELFLNQKPKGVLCTRKFRGSSL